MKIGIFMAYGPQTNLRNEGLGRYIGNLIKGFTEAGHQLTIACPKWSLETIDDLFQDFQIDADRVDFIISTKIPVLWKLYVRKKKKRPMVKLKYHLIYSFTDIIKWFLKVLLSITSLAVFCCIIISLILCAILLLPLVFLTFILIFLKKFFRLLLHGKKFSPVAIAKNMANNLLVLSSKKWSDIFSFLVTTRDLIVKEDLVDKINHSPNQDVWFVPALFWPEVLKLRGTKVVCAPDLVTTQFPTGFAYIDDFTSSTDICTQVLEGEQYFVTYCNWTKDDLLIRQFSKAEKQVRVIPHINNAMESYITIDPKLNEKLQTDKDFTTAFARALIKDIQPPLAFEYLLDFNMSKTRYIFYASQIRPHKNILNLLKAYEYLLRNRYIGIKLFITGNVWGQAKEYIVMHHLEHDIISVPNLSVQTLAAFYHCADLVVNPTLYEGGFPFTFGEGMSVGTPSVMSDIPQVRDVVEPYGLADDMLFDPYDWRSMADKIEWGLKHIDELYKKELPLYQALEKRTAEVVAEEYIRAFQYFIDLDKKKISESELTSHKR